MSSQADDEISLGDLWRIAWHGKWIVASITLIFAVGSVAYALMATEWYRSEALLAPAEARSTSSIAGQLGGLAALAGVSVGGPGNAEALAVLESRDFLRTFIEEHGILALLFEDQWDKERAAWRPEVGDEPPDVRDAIEYFRKSILKVHQNRETQLVTIAVEWTDPDQKGYEVHGIKRRASQFNTDRIDHLYQDPHVEERRFILHYGDLTDSTNLIRIIQTVQPDELYNLGAQSHVQVSFETPEYTANSDALGTLRLLEAIRILGLEKKTRFYQASTSEMFGKVRETPQTETTPFYPRSPYGAAKVYAYWITVNYREAYGMYGCNGILFNHESPLRGETFVTRKITPKWFAKTFGQRSVMR
jgi:hypothetical protein